MRSARARREQAVLTNRLAGQCSACGLLAFALSTPRSLTRLGAAIALSAIALTSADAAGVGGLSCVGTGRSVTCMAQWGAAGDPHIRPVPEPLGEAEKALAETRERRWLTHCRPVIGHDAYGVARYQYAAPGCEFGIGAD
jgi:hypothetical protein